MNKFYYFVKAKNIMAKYTKEYASRKANSRITKIVIKKTGTKHSDIVRWAEEDFIIANLDVLTAAEKKRFDKLVF